MHVPATIRTAFGPRALPRRPMLRVSVTPEELHTLTLALEREAAQAEREGDMGAADHLHWRTALLREAAR